MSNILVSVSTGAMSSLLRKLAALLSDEYKLLKDVRSDIKFLKDELDAMHAFLLRMADLEEPDEQTKLRVMAIRELSYDIEDNIDKFMILVDHESSVMTHGFKKLIDKSKNMINGIRVRHHISKEVKDIKNQVKEVTERYTRYMIDESTSKPRNARIDARVLAIFKDASDLVGIDGPRDELVKWLEKDDDDQLTHHRKVISIVGFGGLGKTTLANQVYHKLRQNFDCHAFVSISRNPDMTKVLSSILSQLRDQTNIDVAGCDQETIIKIREFLEDKRYFIVVDDIWDISAWRILECAFVKNSNGSRIMTTTRINSIARSCCSSHDLVYQIKPLSPVDSKKLFFKRIFTSEDRFPFNLREASEEILKKCGGLPLAIISISGLLADRRTKDQWDRIRKSIGFAFDENSEVEGMRRILSLSYFELPHHLRSCLLYLTLFPEDYEIQRQRLVHRWISEGFIHCVDKQDLLDLGEIYFHELVNRNLIQPVGIGYDAKARACRVHDTILDFLIWKSKEENFSSLLRNMSVMTDFPDIKTRRLSLMANAGISPKLDTVHIRSFGVFGCVEKLPSLLNFKALRVLDLHGYRGLENHYLMNVGRLSQLRYLNISDTALTELPRCIGDLKYLDTLDAKFIYFGKLPDTVTRLHRLVRLFVYSVTKLPDEIGNVKSLQELGCINVFQHSLNFLEELGKLTNLKKLSILWDTDHIKGDKASYKEKIVSSLCKLDTCNLTDLSIIFYLREKDGLIGDMFCPALLSIRNISVHSGEVCRITNWLLSLVNLEYLYIDVNKIEHHDLQLIGSMPSLLEFRMRFSRPCNVGPIIISGGFQQLQVFWFNSDCTPMLFSVEAGAMPMLKELELRIRPDQFHLALSGLGFGIQHFSCLNRVCIELYCNGARAAEVEATEDSFRNMVETHPNHPTLEIKRIRTGRMFHGDEKYTIS